MGEFGINARFAHSYKFNYEKISYLYSYGSDCSARIQCRAIQ